MRGRTTKEMERRDLLRSAALGATIAKLGSPITIRRRSQPRRSSLGTHNRHGLAVTTRPLPRESASLVGDGIATGGEVIVGSVLILVRGSLIALTRGLIVIRPRLILITRGLVVIRPRLILVALDLVAINRRATG